MHPAVEKGGAVKFGGEFGAAAFGDFDDGVATAQRNFADRALCKSGVDQPGEQVAFGGALGEGGDVQRHGRFFCRVEQPTSFLSIRQKKLRQKLCLSRAFAVRWVS